MIFALVVILVMVVKRKHYQFSKNFIRDFDI